MHDYAWKPHLCTCSHTHAPWQTRQVHIAWLTMWFSSLSFISLDRGLRELFWERMVTLCWLLSWRDVSNSNWDLWPAPRGVQRSYLWLWLSTSAWIHPSVCAAFKLCSCTRVYACADENSGQLVCHSGAQQGMNTLVSAEDVKGEQRTGVMWLLLILSGNYSTIYYQRKMGEEAEEEVSYLVWGCKLGFWRAWTRSERQRRITLPFLPLSTVWSDRCCAFWHPPPVLSLSLCAPS